MIKKHGMPYFYSHDSYVKWARGKKLPENSVYYVLYGKNYVVPECVILNEKINKIFHNYEAGLGRKKTFASQIKGAWGKRIDKKIKKIDFNKAFMYIMKLERTIGPMMPIYSIYKNTGSLVDSVISYNRSATAVINWWVQSFEDQPKTIEISSMYAMNRVKLLYIDHGIRVKNVMVNLPDIEMSYKFEMDYRYPLEVFMEMAGSGLTLGGFFDRIPFKQRNIIGMRIKI